MSECYHDASALKLMPAIRNRAPNDFDVWADWIHTGGRDNGAIPKIYRE